MYRLVILAMVLSVCASAQGGPPFLTDDPDTPGNRNWEINIGLIGDRDPSEGAYSTPEIDLNYGIGERIKLTYRLPLAVHETRDPVESVTGGLGNSLLGVKFRFYEKKDRSSPDDSQPVFSLSLYPQLVLNNPTRSVARDVVEPAPQFLLPVETAFGIGPIRFVAETGYWFTAKDTSDSWIRGLMVGHEFKKGTDIYLELYDRSDVSAVHEKPKKRESTLGVGGRKAITKQGSMLLLGMVGRSIAGITVNNGQPQWIAYVGIELLPGKRDNGNN